MLIDKTQLDLNQFTEQGVRQNLSGVYFHDKKAVGCNGHVLVRVPNIDTPSEEFPNFEGYTPLNNEECVSIPADTCERMKKSLPKKMNHLPILKNAMLSRNGEEKTRFLISTDLENKNIISFNPVEATFPDYERLFPKKEPKAVISINPDYLVMIGKFISNCQKQNGQKSVTLEIHGTTEPIYFYANDMGQGRTIDGLIMPVRGPEKSCKRMEEEREKENESEQVKS